MLVTPRVLVSTLVVAMLLLCAGCGSDERHSNQSGSLVENFDQKRSDVERTKHFRLYFLGESFEGFALSSVLYDRDPWRTVSFVYGDCEPAGGTDGGCAPPLEVQVAPACTRRLQTVRDQDGRLELYTGWETITIFGGGRDRMRRAARALRPLSSDEVTRNLPPPAREARDTSLTCREQAGKTR